jgi:hypothetical protein
MGVQKLCIHSLGGKIQIRIRAGYSLLGKILSFSRFFCKNPFRNKNGICTILQVEYGS